MPASQIVFSADGRFLFHDEHKEHETVVWRVADGERLGRVPGRLIGRAEDGRTFLTHDRGVVRAWETLGGAPLSVADLPPEAYPLPQRAAITPIDDALVLRVEDALQPGSPGEIRVRGKSQRTPTLDSWRVAPNGYLFVTLYGDIAGHDWAEGVAIDLMTRRRAYTFDVNRFGGGESLCFSAEHGLFASGGSGHFTIYDLATGHSLRQNVTHFANLGCEHIAFSPAERWLVAVNARFFKPRGDGMEFGVQMLDVSELVLRYALTWQGRLVQEIITPGLVTDLKFHPDGRRLAAMLGMWHSDIHLYDTLTGELVGRYAWAAA